MLIVPLETMSPIRTWGPAVPSTWMVPLLSMVVPAAATRVVAPLEQVPSLVSSRVPAETNRAGLAAGPLTVTVVGWSPPQAS